MSLALFGWMTGCLSAGLATTAERMPSTATLIGVHMSCYAVGLIVGGLAAPRLPRRVGQAAGVVLVAGVAVLMGAHDPVVSLVGASSLGCAGGVVLAAAQYTLHHRWPEAARRLLLIGAIAASGTAAVASGVLGIVPSAWTPVTAAVPALAMGLVARFDLPTGASGRGRWPRRRWCSLRRSGPVPRASRHVVAGLTFIACAVGLEHTLVSQLGPMLQGSESRTSVVSFVPSALFVGLMAGRLVALGLERTVSRTLLTASLGVTAAGLTALLVVHGSGALVIAAVVTGAGLGSLYPLAVDATLGAATDPASTSATVSVVVGAALVLTPVAIGAVTDLGGARYGLVALLVLCGVAVLACRAMLGIRPTDPVRSAPEG
ncbi:MAG: MFS transporter [Dermatophilaceae bacterium]